MLLLILSCVEPTSLLFFLICLLFDFACCCALIFLDGSGRWCVSKPQSDGNQILCSASSTVSFASTMPVTVHLLIFVDDIDGLWRAVSFSLFPFIVTPSSFDFGLVAHWTSPMNLLHFADVFEFPDSFGHFLDVTTQPCDVSHLGQASSNLIFFKRAADSVHQLVQWNA